MDTQFHYERHLCPKCLNEAEVVVWDVLHAESDPDLKERLLAKDLLSFICQNCGETLTVGTGFLYVDEALGLAIYRHPELTQWFDENAEDLSAQKACLAALNQQVPIGFAGVSRHRLAADLNSVNELIHIASHHLDDRIMMLLKVALMARYAEDEGVAIQMLYFIARQGEQLCFQALMPENEWQTIEVNAELYDQALELLQPSLPPDDEWLLLDLAWARQMMRQLANEVET